MNKGLIASLALLLSSPVMADWTLNNDHSRLNFVSVKKNIIGEVHKFKQLRGTLSDNGQLNIEIPLNSVETLIPIRNERMQKMLFETKLFPTAELSAKVATKDFELKEDESKIVSMNADLGLHGVNKLINVEVLVTRVSNTKLQVVSLKPIILYPADFGLDKGLMKLQAAANLPGITHSVPVSFVLTFNK